MRVAAAAFKINEYANRDAAAIIVLGFSGQLQLKSWWDNHLTYDERLAILNHTKLDTQGNSIQDPVETLIHTITLHFISNPKEGQAAAKSILINLRCHTLLDYRWYKDAFLTNVLKREDGIQNF